MKNELRKLLSAYLKGRKSLRDVAAWLATVDWDASEVSGELRAAIGRVELLTTEALGGLRGEDELRGEAASLVGMKTGSLIAAASPSPAPRRSAYPR